MSDKEYHVSVRVFGGGVFYMRGSVTPEGKTLIGEATEVEVEAGVAFIKGLEPLLEYLNNPPEAP